MTVAREHEEAFLDLAASVVAHVRANEPDTLVYMLTKDPPKTRAGRLRHHACSHDRTRRGESP